MQNYTQTILLIGNHASLHANAFVENSNQHKIIQLKFESSNPFYENSLNKIWIDNQKVETKHEYNLQGLVTAIHEKNISSRLSEVTLIVGDPSELIYQAFLLAMLKEDPNDFRRINENESPSDVVNLFLYPVGMMAQDIRKELSTLMYCLKKHEMATYLIRKEEKDLDSLFKLLLNSLTFMSIVELEDQIKGIEHLVSPRLSMHE
jgi:hypothetical protein